MQAIKSFFLSDITTIPSVLQQNHLPSLDGLRGISILIVVIAHFNSHFHIGVLDLIFSNGAVGVYIFFVMSGFLITTLLLKEKIKSGTISLRNFYIRRALRILPVAYLYILVIIILNTIFDLHIPASAYLIAGLFLVNFFHFFSVPYYVFHYWSLSAEEQFYLLIPPLIKLNIKVYRYLIFVILSISFFSRFIFEKNPNAFWSRFIFDASRNMDGLIIGSLFSILVFMDLIPWGFIRKHKILLNILLFGLIILFNRESSSIIARIFFNHTAYSFLIGLLIVSNIYQSDDIIYKILNNKILAQTGVISYSIYIWQQLFTSELFEKYFPLNILLLAVVSASSYYIYEKKFLSLKKRFIKTSSEREQNIFTVSKPST
ncbi:MAG: acyltransferase [Chitinophagaceae bacterium]